ncbi:MAG: POTRA domain-containing protein [Candidatus Cloacimonadota bacterium]|nr:POTRA domain-containing protein [Candidatus Cloacimonadota bacterium]
MITYILHKNQLKTHFAGIILFLSLLFFYPLFAEPLKIKSIEITGNKHFSQAEILKSLRIKEGDEFSYQELNNNLNNVLQLYKNKGFYLIQILPPEVLPDESGEFVNIKIEILENNKLIVSDINFSGNRYFSNDKLKKMISTKSAQPFSIEKLNADLKSIVDAYGEKGYPFCEVAIDSLSINNEKISVLCRIIENDFVRISELIFKGNEITKDKTLKLITNFEENKIYRNSRIESAKRNLIHKKYISDAEIVPLNKRELLITIKEKQMNHFQGVLGFASQEDVSFIEKLTGYIDFTFLNILGTDREINLSWRKLKKNSSQFYISYIEPFILHQQISAELSFKRKSIDTIYVNSEFQLKTNFLMSSYDKIGVKIFTKSSLQDTIRTNKKGVGAEWRKDKLDYPINPKTGYYYSLSYAINWKNKKSYHQEISADIQCNIPINKSKNNILSLRGRTNLLYTSGDSLSKYDYYYFGGYDNLRGFIDNQFKSDKFCIFNIEYRYLLSRDSRAFAFLDYGYSAENRHLLGCGFGIHMKSKIGIIKIDYGIGYQDRQWTNPLDGTLHFGIETGF